MNMLACWIGSGGIWRICWIGSGAQSLSFLPRHEYGSEVWVELQQCIHARSLARPHPAPRFRWRRLWGQVRSFDVKSISKYKWIYIEVSLLVLYVKDALPQGTKYYWEKLESWTLAPFYIFACFCPGANIWKSIIYRRSDIKVVEADQPVWRTFVHQSTRLAYDDSQPANLIKVNFSQFQNLCLAMTDWRRSVARKYSFSWMVTS